MLAGEVLNLASVAAAQSDAAGVTRAFKIDSHAQPSVGWPHHSKQQDSMAQKNKQRKTAVAPKKVATKAPTTPTLQQIGTAAKRIGKKAVAAVATGSAAAIGILTKAHDVHQAYEWLKPILDKVLFLSVRQSDNWAVQMNACADAGEQVTLLHRQLARTALVVAVIERALAAAAKLVAEHGTVTKTQANSFSKALLDGLDDLGDGATPGATASEVAASIVSKAEMSALVKVKNTADKAKKAAPSVRV